MTSFVSPVFTCPFCTGVEFNYRESQRRSQHVESHNRSLWWKCGGCDYLVSCGHFFDLKRHQQACLGLTDPARAIAVLKPRGWRGVENTDRDSRSSRVVERRSPVRSSHGERRRSASPQRRERNRDSNSQPVRTGEGGRSSRKRQRGQERWVSPTIPGLRLSLSPPSSPEVVRRHNKVKNRGSGRSRGAKVEEDSSPSPRRTGPSPPRKDLKSPVKPRTLKSSVRKVSAAAGADPVARTVVSEQVPVEQPGVQQPSLVSLYDAASRFEREDLRAHIARGRSVRHVGSTAECVPEVIRGKDNTYQLVGSGFKLVLPGPPVERVAAVSASQSRKEVQVFSGSDTDSSPFE